MFVPNNKETPASKIQGPGTQSYCQITKSNVNLKTWPHKEPFPCEKA